MSNDTQVAAHTALVEQFADAAALVVQLEEYDRHNGLAEARIDEKRLRAAVEASARQLAEQPGFVMVRAEMVEFLQGAKPLEGLWFGERHPAGSGLYWWRQHLTASPTAPSTEASEPVGDKLADRALAKSFRETPREASLADQAGMRRAISDPLTNRAFNIDGRTTPPPAPVLSDAEIVQLLDMAGDQDQTYRRSIVIPAGCSLVVVKRAAIGRASRGAK